MEIKNITEIIITLTAVLLGVCMGYIATAEKRKEIKIQRKVNSWLERQSELFKIGDADLFDNRGAVVRWFDDLYLEIHLKETDKEVSKSVYAYYDNLKKEFASRDYRWKDFTQKD